MLFGMLLAHREAVFQICLSLFFNNNFVSSFGGKIKNKN